MAEFIVNTALFTAALVLLIARAVTNRRRRQRDRRERAAERRAILAAFTTAVAPEPRSHDTDPRATVPAPPHPEATRPAPGATLDAESLTALLELLEDRRPSRHGLLAGLVASPRSVWTAGVRAGQSVGVRTMAAAPRPEPDEICRVADDDQAVGAIDEIKGTTQTHGHSTHRFPQIDEID